MPDNLELEHNRRVRNGKAGPHYPGRSPVGLGNTNPVATLGSTFVGVPVPYARLASLLEEFHGQTFVVQAAGSADLYVGSPEGLLVLETKTVGKGKSLSPAGQIVLFKKVMEEWGFE